MEKINNFIKEKNEDREVRNRDKEDMLAVLREENAKAAEEKKTANDKRRNQSMENQHKLNKDRDFFLKRKEGMRNLRLTIKKMMRDKNLRIREEKRQKKLED